MAAELIDKLETLVEDLEDLAGADPAGSLVAAKVHEGFTAIRDFAVQALAEYEQVKESGDDPEAEQAEDGAEDPADGHGIVAPEQEAAAEEATGPETEGDGAAEVEQGTSEGEGTATA